MCAVLVVASLLTLAQRASAHTMGVSRGEYIVRGDVVTATLLFRAEELRAATSEADLVSELSIAADGAPCQGALVSTAPDAPDGVRIVARFSCPNRPTHLHVHAGFLARFPGGHAHVVAIARDDAARSEHLVVLARPDVDVDLGAPASPGFMSFVLAGIEHILTARITCSSCSDSCSCPVTRRCRDAIASKPWCSCSRRSPSATRSRWPSRRSGVTRRAHASSSPSSRSRLPMSVRRISGLRPFGVSARKRASGRERRNYAVAGSSRFLSASSTASRSRAACSSWVCRGKSFRSPSSASTRGSRSASSAS